MDQDDRPCLERDLLSSQWIKHKIKVSDRYAQNLYAALCNNLFQKQEVWPVLADETWSCSWRSAGGIIADILGEGDYMDWYCSGMMISHPDDDLLDSPRRHIGYVREGEITEEIQQDLASLGWVPIDGS